MTPWTFDLIRQLLDRGKGEVFLQKVTFLFNRILEGQGGDTTAWTTSRMVALGKKDGGIRPIAVGEVWLRLLGRIAARKVAKVGNRLAPAQYGVGFKGGAEVIIHTCSLFAKWVRARESGSVAISEGLQSASDPWCMVAVDLTNAFNTVRRSAVEKGVKERCPELFPFFEWVYGKPSTLRLGSGEVVCSSATGVRQGDPLGPLYFCLAIHDTILRLKTEIPEVYALFYMDDGTLLGPKSKVVEAVKFLEKEFASLGLAINLKKGKTTGWDATLQAENEVAHGFLWTKEGVKVLGVAVGGAVEGVCGMDENYARQYVAAELKKMADVLPLLQELHDPQVAFIILRSAICSRPSFLARSCPPNILREAAERFDDEVDACLAKIADWRGPLPEVCKILRGLPANLGGASLRRLRDASKNAYTASWTQAAWHIAEHHNWLWVMAVEARVLKEEEALLESATGGLFRHFDDCGIHIGTGEIQEVKSQVPKGTQLLNAAGRKGLRALEAAKKYRAVDESAPGREEVKRPAQAPDEDTADEWTQFPSILSQSALQRVADCAEQERLLQHLCSVEGGE